jgi:hypothetical protein
MESAALCPAAILLLETQSSSSDELGRGKFTLTILGESLLIPAYLGQQSDGALIGREPIDVHAAFERSRPRQLPVHIRFDDLTVAIKCIAKIIELAIVECTFGISPSNEVAQSKVLNEVGALSCFESAWRVVPHGRHAQ